MSGQIEFYRGKLSMIAIGEDKDLDEFIAIQNKGHEDLVQSLNTEGISFDLKNKLSELSNIVGVAGTDRQKLIKAAIKSIIENLVPNRMKMLFNFSKQDSHLTFEEFDKLYKMNQK